MTRLTILFAPVRRDETLVLERQGTQLIANGARHDLAALAARDDDSPADGWVQAVRATPGGLEAVVLLPHGADAPEAVRFPAPVTVDTDGPIAVPGTRPARRRKKG
jgi:hypothetical protein